MHLRRTFKELHNIIRHDDSFEAQSRLLELENLLTTMFNKMQMKTLVKDLPVIEMGLNEKGQKALRMFGDLNIFEAIEQTRKMFNAIENERGKKVADLKVESLEIVLLDPDEHQ
jgi:hypothetical protein